MVPTLPERFGPYGSSTWMLNNMIRINFFALIKLLMADDTWQNVSVIIAEAGYIPKDLLHPCRQVELDHNGREVQIVAPIPLHSTISGQNR